MVDFRILPPPKDSQITEIYIEEICANAKFCLDYPLLYSPTDILRLVDGQWFVVRNHEEQHLGGRWALVSS